MRRRQLAGIIVGMILLGGLGIVAAQPPDCVGRPCVRLPLVRAAGVTAPTAAVTFIALPTAAPVPAPTVTIPPILYGPCVIHAPAPAEGAQAWLTEYNLAPGEAATLCVRLLIDRRVPAHTVAIAVLHYPDGDRLINPAGPIEPDGVTLLPFVVAQLAPGRLVVIDVTVWVDGQTYPAQTAFLSIGAPTAMPTSSPQPPAPPTATPSPTMLARAPTP